MVQGVGYRYACRRIAGQLALRGWVRNLPDGGVEVMAAGPPAALASLVAWCRRGPAGAAVRDCRVAPQAADASLGPFEIRL